MRAGVPITDRIFWIGVNDHDTQLFEELWPMPHGIAYNSYFIDDERTAIVEAAKGSFVVEYLEKLKGALGGRKLDYVVINHVEPDHSGALKALLDIFPATQFVGNRKTADLLAAFYDIRDNVRIVDDGDELELGRCRLKFVLTPMVHWPETMMTFEMTSGTLFSGDAFGAFGAVDEGIFDDQIADMSLYEDEALRYFVNVIGKYSQMVQKALARLQGLEIATIASSHGPVWRKSPGRIMQLYDRWSRQEAEEGAVVVYASMYGNTERMMEAVARSLSGAGIGSVVTHNVSRSHPSFILRDVWRYRGVVLGAPTYNTGVFPLMDHFMRLLENKALKGRILGLFSSYGWAGGAMKEMAAFGERMKWELVQPAVEVKCAPTDEQLEACALLGRNVAERLKRSLAV